jgi:hypothetical protein
LADIHGVPAISIRQPWAELVLRGKKTVEVRDWHHAYRGPLWVHTGRKTDGYAQTEWQLRDPTMGDLFTGGFVGQVELTAIVPFDAHSWEALRPQHLDTGRFRLGLFAFFLRNPRRLQEPLEGPGELRLFEVDEETQRVLRARLH